MRRCGYSQSDFNSAVHSNQEKLFPPGPAEEFNPWFWKIQADGFGQCLQRSCQFLINDSALKSSGGWTAPLIRLQIWCWCTSLHLSPPPRDEYWRLWRAVLHTFLKWNGWIWFKCRVQQLRGRKAKKSQTHCDPPVTFLPHRYWQLWRDVHKKSCGIEISDSNAGCSIRGRKSETHRNPLVTLVLTIVTSCVMCTPFSKGFRNRKIRLNCRLCKSTQNHRHPAIYPWQLVLSIVKIVAAYLFQVLQLDSIKMQWQRLGGNHRHTAIHLWQLVLTIMKSGAHLSQMLQLNLIKIQCQWLGGNQRQTAIHLWQLTFRPVNIHIGQPTFCTIRIDTSTHINFTYLHVDSWGKVPHINLSLRPGPSR